jgi:Coenzyme PQQ synthesis protein D (PqqD)
MVSGDQARSPVPDRKPAVLPRRREGVAAQVADGEAVLLDIESGAYFSLNSVGSRIWELCDGTRSTAEIVSVICDEFDVAEDVALADAQEILDELEKEKLVVKS